MGELIAWIIGWDLIVEYAIGNIAVAISWSDYFTGMLRGLRFPSLGIENGIQIPEHLTMDYLTASRGFADNHELVEQTISQGYTIQALTNMKGDDLAKISEGLTPQVLESFLAWTNAPMIGGWRIVVDLPALAITLFITALVYIGIRESKVTANIMTILKVAIILLVVFLGLNYVNPANWLPFAPNGVEGVLKGVSAVFFAYIGFDALATTAEEARNPSRDLPRAMILSLVICTILVYRARARYYGNGFLHSAQCRRSAGVRFRSAGREHSVCCRTYRRQRSRGDGNGFSCFPDRSAASLDGDEPRRAFAENLFVNSPEI